MGKATIPLIALSFCLLLTLSHGWIQKRKAVVGDHKTIPSNERKAYIVYMGNGPESGIPTVDHHHSLLSTVIGDEKLAMEHRIHSYGRSINAFAARLLPHEAERLKGMEGVISVFPNILRKLHTTRSWDFVGLPMSVKRNNVIESDLIVGMIDTGIYMDNPFFDDTGFGPPPAKWKGSCDKGTSANFSGCNNKVIGAKYYYDPHASDGTGDDEKSPTDTEGHGTHTSSTVAGAAVSGASLYDLAQGTGRGGVPSARIAMYKVCWSMGCSEISILSAFDDAIADGVDVISISIGGPAGAYFVDSIGVGAFHAMQKGILTVASGGNDGPIMSTITNLPPWTFTIAASGLDRMFVTDLKLGNGKQFAGRNTLNTYTPKRKNYPLIDGLHAKNHSINGDDPRGCSEGLDESKVKGKIVYCDDQIGSDDVVIENKGIGFISPSFDTDADYPSFLPTTMLKDEDCDYVENYINSTKNPTAVIEKTRIVKRPAPFIADFSSRGPNSISDFVLKPDIAAPGADILAGWTKLSSLTEMPGDDRYVKFNIISGTSMACPHVSAASLYVKSFHPDWSPAAIKSALMTTTTPIKLGAKGGPLSYGSGQINPTGAVHPGLVYDMNTNDYIAYLCKEGYKGTTLRILVGDKVDCPKHSKAQVLTDGINYPSMSYTIRDATAKHVRAVFERTVTNVGYGKSVYKASVKADKGLLVNVFPDTLTFNEIHEKKSFKVMVRVEDLSEVDVLNGVLEWSDSRHKVRSPIVIVNYEMLQVF